MEKNDPHPLQVHYDELYQHARQLLLTSAYTLDKRIDDPTDNRLGLTLLFRPSEEIKTQIHGFLEDLKIFDPKQYYYPSTDIHVTVLSIISCYQDFDLQAISLPDYVELIRKNMPAQEGFEISFRGITASSAGVMVQGFPKGPFLDQIRNALRQSFRASELEQSIDTRYTLQTAHCTVVRFREPLINTKAFAEVLDRYRDYDFGTCRVEALELVHNDWYQRYSRVEKIHEFSIHI